MNKPAAVVPKGPTTFEGRIAHLIRMLCSDRRGEVIAAIRALARILKAAGNSKIHTLADRVEHGGGDKTSRASLNAAEMQRIYDAAYKKGFSDGSEHGKKSAIVAGPSIGTFNVGIDSGVNGYSWEEIVQHCAVNKHIFHGRDFEFIESIARQFENGCSRPTPKQAPWLKDLFMRRFNGRID